MNIETLRRAIIEFPRFRISESTIPFRTDETTQEDVTCFAPRHLLIVSARDDMASYDADWIISNSQAACSEMGIEEHAEHGRYEGNHALTQERFDDIVDWLTKRATGSSI